MMDISRSYNLKYEILELKQEFIEQHLNDASE